MVSKSKTEAKELIKGKVLILFLTVFLVPTIITLVITLITNIIPLAITRQLQALTIKESFLVLYNVIVGSDTFLFNDDGIWFAIFGGVASLLTSPLLVGNALFHINVATDGSEKASDFIKPYAKIVKINIVMIGYAIMVFVGFLLLVIPGIYLALKYAFLPNVLADRPELGIGETFTEAAKLSKGYMTQILWFPFSYLLWMLLIPFTLMLAIVYVEPYISTAQAKMYINIKTEKEPPPPQPDLPPQQTQGYYPYYLQG